MTMSDRVEALIGIAGEDVTYRNQSGYVRSTVTLKNAPSYTDTTVQASIRKYKAKELSGLVQENDREVRIAAQDLAAFTPRQNDKITIASEEYNVESVYPRSAKGDDAVFIIQIRGNN